MRRPGFSSLVALASLLVTAVVGAATATVGGVAARPEVAAQANRAADRLVVTPGCVTAPSPEAYFAGGYGPLHGGDYQRALRVNTRRTLWTLQDAFVNDGLTTTLVHNVAVVQEGDCYSMLGTIGESWLFNDQTTNQRHWFWVLDGYQNSAGVHVYVAEMTSSGNYLEGQVTPIATWVVTLDSVSLQPLAARKAGNPGRALFGWSVTTDENWVYQYSWCLRQFGWTSVSDDPFGFDTRCTNRTYLARIPLHGDPAAAPKYWNGRSWTADPGSAVSVFGPRNTARAIANPVDVVNDNGVWRLISKPDDWWGSTVFTYHAEHPFGPWVPDGMAAVPGLCADCNTYYVSWVPNASRSGWDWAISNNHWHVPDTDFFHPTFHSIAELIPL